MYLCRIFRYTSFYTSQILRERFVEMCKWANVFLGALQCLSGGPGGKYGNPGNPVDVVLESCARVLSLSRLARARSRLFCEACGESKNISYFTLSDHSLSHHQCREKGGKKDDGEKNLFFFSKLA